METGTVHVVRWYKPGDDVSEEQGGVPGSYCVNEEGIIEARLYGSFSMKKPSLFGLDDDVPDVLQGVAISGGVTLVGCSKRSFRRGWTGRSEVEFTANYALEGYGVLESNDLSFTDLLIRFKGQDYWTQWDRFAVMGAGFPSADDLGAVSKPVPASEAKIEAGSLRLIDGSIVLEDVNDHAWRFESRSVFKIEFQNPVKLIKLIDQFVYPLQTMLMCASGRNPGIAELLVTNRGWGFGAESPQPLSRYFTMRIRHGRVAELPDSASDYLFRLADIDFESDMRRMLSVLDSHRFSLELYGLLHTGEIGGGYLAKFSTAAQMVDAFERSLRGSGHGDGTFDKRLKVMEEDCGEPVRGLGVSKRWRSDVAKLRNIVLHGDAHSHEILRDQRPLIAGFEMLVILFEVRLLVAFGLDVATAKSLVELRNDFYWRRSRIEEFMPVLTSYVRRVYEARMK